MDASRGTLDPLGYGLVVVAVAALIGRRRAPVPAFVASFAATTVFLLLRYPLGPIVQLTGVAVYSLAAWRPGRLSGALCLASAAVTLPAVLTVGYAGEAPASVSGTIVLTLA